MDASDRGEHAGVLPVVWTLFKPARVASHEGQVATVQGLFGMGRYSGGSPDVLHSCETVSILVKRKIGEKFSQFSMQNRVIA